MPRSLRVRHDYIDKVRVAVARNGYPNQRALAHDTGLSRSTVSKFMTGNQFDYAKFEELCRLLNLDWQEITTSAEVIFTPPRIRTNTQKKNQI